MSQTETIEPEVSDGCPKCGNLESWGHSSWCPACGFYPRLGTSLQQNHQPVAEIHEPPKSSWDLWQRAPTWIKILCTGVFAIFGMSVLVRAATPDGGLARTLWSFSQLIIGAGIFATLHVIALLSATMKTNRVGFIDAIVHPIDVWRPTIQDLPRTARRIWLGAWGLTAAICAMAVIGGLRYSVLLDDWGFRQRAQSEMGSRIRAAAMEKAIADRKHADNLEDAVKGAAKGGAKGGPSQQESEGDVQSNDCVVIGYNVSPADGRVAELILASVVEGELKYVGTVSQGLPPDIQDELSRRLPGLKQNSSFVKCPQTAVWVKPIVACRLNFKSWSDNNVMREPAFKELLSEITGVE